MFNAASVRFEGYIDRDSLVGEGHLIYDGTRQIHPDDLSSLSNDNQNQYSENDDNSINPNMPSMPSVNCGHDNTMLIMQEEYQSDPDYNIISNETIVSNIRSIPSSINDCRLMDNRSSGKQSAGASDSSDDSQQTHISQPHVKT